MHIPFKLVTGSGGCLERGGWRVCSPSPGGEGWGEGERFHSVFGAILSIGKLCRYLGLGNLRFWYLVLGIWCFPCIAQESASTPSLAASRYLHGEETLRAFASVSKAT